MKKAFTLIELMVVVAITSILLVVVTNFFISIIQSNNKARIENELRNEANVLTDQIAKDLRTSKCECLSFDTNSNSKLFLYGSDSCPSNDGDGNCPTPILGPTPYAIYEVSDSNKFFHNLSQISSDDVYVRACGDTGCTCNVPTPGFQVTGTNRLYKINLNLTQARDDARADFCGKIQTEQIVKPRN